MKKGITPMKHENAWIRWFSDTNRSHISIVGGKTLPSAK